MNIQYVYYVNFNFLSKLSMSCKYYCIDETMMIVISIYVGCRVGLVKIVLC